MISTASRSRLANRALGASQHPDVSRSVPSARRPMLSIASEASHPPSLSRIWRAPSSSKPSARRVRRLVEFQAAARGLGRCRASSAPAGRGKPVRLLHITHEPKKNKPICSHLSFGVIKRDAISCSAFQIDTLGGRQEASHNADRVIRSHSHVPGVRDDLIELIAQKHPSCIGFLEVVNPM